MSLMEHLGELRMRLVRIVVCLIVATLVFYLGTDTVVQFLLAPVSQYMPLDESGQVQLNVFGALTHSRFELRWLSGRRLWQLLLLRFGKFWLSFCQR